MTTLTTPKWAIPYPDPNEPVAGGAAAMGAMATKIESLLGFLIADTGDIAATAGFLEFTSIPQTFQHLRLISWLRLSVAYGVQVAAMFNGDTTAASYDSALGAAGGAAGTALGANLHAITPGSGAPANSFGMTELLIPHYRKTGPKLAYAHYIAYRGDNTLAGSREAQQGGAWLGPAAITAIRLTPASGQWVAGCRAQLWGIA